MSVRIEHVIVIHAISFQSRIILVLLYLFVLILGHFASFRALSYVIKISEFENRRRGSTLNQILWFIQNILIFSLIFSTFLEEILIKIYHFIYISLEVLLTSTILYVHISDFIELI